MESGFRVREMVTDNQRTNVTAFSILLRGNGGDKYHFFTYPEPYLRGNEGDK